MSQKYNSSRNVFTSHYVPIKSAGVNSFPTVQTIFTSHYVPIKSYTIHSKMYCVLDLHPIMFLLNRRKTLWCVTMIIHLHPIMFLLNRHEYHDMNFFISFTSHYVPIKSGWVAELNSFNIHLHPIMFLLNRIS